MTITTDEAAAMAGVSPVTIRSWVMRGLLEPMRRGARPLMFWPADVARVQRDLRSREWVERHAQAVGTWQSQMEMQR